MQVTGTRQTNPAVDLHDLPRIDLICLSHYHAYALNRIPSPSRPLLPVNPYPSDHFDQDVEASLRRDIPIITTPHAKDHLTGKGDHESFTSVHDLDFFDDIMVDIKSGKEKKPAIKVTGMPGKHVPQGVLSTMNDLISAVSRSLFRGFGGHQES